MGDFRQLKAWQEAKRLATLSRDLVRFLPPDEAFALGAQWRRAAYKEVRLARTHCARLVTALARSLSGNASPDNRQRLRPRLTPSAPAGGRRQPKFRSAWPHDRPTG